MWESRSLLEVDPFSDRRARFGVLARANEDGRFRSKKFICNGLQSVYTLIQEVKTGQ